MVDADPAAPYFLTSARLGFRRWSPDDVGLADALWGDPAVTSLIGGPFSVEQVRARLLREIETDAKSGIQYWPMFLLVTGEFAGCCGLRPYRPDERIAELGFHLRQSQWGKGLAVEGARAVTGTHSRRWGWRASSQATTLTTRPPSGCFIASGSGERTSSTTGRPAACTPRTCCTRASTCLTRRDDGCPREAEPGGCGCWGRVEVEGRARNHLARHIGA